MSGNEAPRAIVAIPASIGRRAGAYVIDGAIAFGVVVVLGGIVAVVLQVVLRPTDERGLAILILWLYLIVSLLALAWWLVYTAMQGGRGSLGQRALGLRLADQQAVGPIGFWRALLRNVVWGLACSIVVGYFTPLFDRSGRGQGWHDMVARALVIDGRETDAAASARRPAAPLPTANPYLPPPAGAVAPPLPPSAPAAPASFAPAPAPEASARSAPAPAASAPRAATSGHAQEGLISAVPGVTSPPAAPTPAPAAAPEPAAATPAPVPAEGDDLDQTRAAAPGAPPAAVLVWDNGTRIAVYGPTLFGRNPAREDGATAVAVRDETLSLSKTHFEVDGDATGAWVLDRHSTNGVVLVRGVGRTTLTPGERMPLRTGDRLEFGDRSATIEGVA